MVTNHSVLPPYSEEVVVLIDVVAVYPRAGFQLDIEFENGERRRFDMRPLLCVKPDETQGHSVRRDKLARDWR